MRTAAWLAVLAVLATSPAASAVNLLTNGDWSAGETGWERAYPSGPDVTLDYDVTWSGPTPPEGTLYTTQGSVGWIQPVEVSVGEVCTLAADWAGDDIGWAEIMLFSYDYQPTAQEAGARADVGNAADIAYKRDNFGLGGPTWDWEKASTQPFPGGNGGTIHSLGWVVVATKLGNGGSLTVDNITLTPEPAAALLLGLPMLFLRRRRA